MIWSSPVLSCAVLFYDVRSNSVLSCAVLSWYVVLCVFYGCHFRILTVSAVAVSIFLCCPFVCLSRPPSICLRFSVLDGVGRLLLSASLFRALVDGPGLHTDTKGSHFTCSSCSRVHFTLVPSACVSSPRDWVVSRGSHRQQNIDMANYRIDSCSQESPRGNHRSQRPCVPALAFPNLFFFLHPVLCDVQTVSQLFPGCVPFPYCSPACWWFCSFFKWSLAILSLLTRTQKILTFQQRRCMPCGRQKLALCCFVLTLKTTPPRKE